MRTIRKSVLYQYIISYASVVLLACLLMGIFLFSISVHEIEKTNFRNTQNKVDLAAADFELQYDIMRDISIEISLKPVYKPGYFSKNKYYEYELLQDFKKYHAYSPMFDDYILFYSGTESLFTGSGSTNQISTYFQSSLNIENYIPVWEKILAAKTFDILYSADDSPQYLFWVFPLQLQAADNSQQAVLAFITSHSTYLSRLQLFGLENGFDLLLLEQNPLFSCQNSGIGSPVSIENKNQYIFSSVENTPVQICVQKSSVSNQTLIYRYQRTLFATGVGLTVLLIIVGAIAAYINYHPIKKLKNTLQGSCQLSGNELILIQNSFQKIRHEKEYNERIIELQKESLQHQMVDVLLSGGISQNLQNKAWEMGIQLDNRGCYVLAIHLNQENQQGSRETWFKISTKQIAHSSIYTGNIGADNCFNVIFCTNKPMQEADFIHIFQSTSDLQIGVSCLVTKPEQLSTALLEAHFALYEARDTETPIHIFEKMQNHINSPGYSRECVEAMTNAVRESNYPNALFFLHSIMDQIKTTKQSITYARHIYSEIVAEFIKMGKEKNISLSQSQLKQACLSDSTKKFMEISDAILSQLCAPQSPNCEEQDIQKIILFIHEHCCDYNMSLDLIQEKFGYSISQLSAMIKEYLGESFRSYLISLRMEKAKNLLKTELRVAEISEQVGYSSVSHFMKTFRNYFGEKPSYFRNNT